MGQMNTRKIRLRLYEIIFEADTRAGRAFDLLLILAILASVLVVMLDSIPSLRTEYLNVFSGLEWFFTLLFSIEYLLRLWTVGRPASYALSALGLIDLLGILPTYLALLFPGTHFLTVIRLLRVLRIFRVLQLVQFLQEARLLGAALQASLRKIMVFLFTVLILVVIFGALMYVVEGDENGFSSIPMSIYWAIVTMTTVGYGDISPQTPLGQAMASLIMILGYGIIAVPTGMVTARMTVEMLHKNRQSCPACSKEGHADDALFCKYCGAELNPGQRDD